MNIDNRVKYYLGNLYEFFINKQKIQYHVTLNEKEEISYNRIQLINNNMLFYDNYNYQIKNYVNDLRKYFLESKVKQFVVFIALGDINIKMKQFCFTKSRPTDLTNNYNILLNLNTPRHWNGLQDVNIHDIPYNKKNNKIIWRGMSTGKQKRVIFVDKFQNNINKNIDIKFSSLVQNTESNNYILHNMSIKEQLQSKFIISIEGNDVATNLKWILYSNSVAIMPKPTVSSWIMEDTLIAGIHYVEIMNDYSDLEEKYNWCLNNLEECKKIADNGKEYMQQFLNINTEKEITKQLIDIYCNTVIMNSVLL